MSHSLVQPLFVEFTLPPANDYGGDTITYQVGECPALAHELIDADDDSERLNWYIRDNRQSGGKSDKSSTGHARSALRGQHCDDQNGEFLGERQRSVGGLCKKQRRQRHVDVRSIQIKAVTDGYHQSNYGLRCAQPLHLLHHVGKYGLRGTGAKDN